LILTFDLVYWNPFALLEKSLMIGVMPHPPVVGPGFSIHPVHPVNPVKSRFDNRIVPAWTFVIRARLA
jgi:hypothetical protein